MKKLSTKRNLTALLAISMLSSMSVPAFATETAVDGDYHTDVTYTGTSEGNEWFLLTVPATMAPGSTDDVTLKGAWPAYKTYNVTADKTVEMKGSLGNDKTLDITFPGISLAGSNTAEVTQTEQVVVEDMKAIFGKYEGTFNYTLDILGGETNWAQAVTMRNITSNEYSLLCDATNESDDIMHWSNMYSVTDSLFNSSRVICGYISARTKHSAVDGASASWGFRPAFEATNSEDCVNLNVGDVVTIGTLYVGSTPIKVPTNPTSGGDISSYGSNNTEKITLGDAIDDTDYQVKAVYVGNGLFVCSCNMLVNISCNQIRLALL